MSIAILGGIDRLTPHYMKHGRAMGFSNIKVFSKKCITPSNCVISEKQGNINTELKTKILKTAAIYQAEKKIKTSKK